MGHLIIPQSGVQLFRGEVFLSSLDATAGRQNVPLGIVQEFNFDDTVDLKEMRGPKSRQALAVAQSGAKISGSCKFGSTNAQILAVLRGATLSTLQMGTAPNSYTVTKAARKGSDNIRPALVELYDVDNESGPHALFYNVIFNDLKNPQKLDDYTIWDALFLCYPDPVSLSIYDIFYPGDQTTAFTLPAQYTPDAGATTAQSDYASVKGSS